MDFVVEEKHNPLDVTSNLDFIYLFKSHDCYTNLVVCRVVILIIPVHPWLGGWKYNFSHVARDVW